MGTANARAGTQSVLQAHQMGSAKSVTRFFISSRGIGKGGELGGLVGAQKSGDDTWSAHLSTMATTTKPPLTRATGSGTVLVQRRR